MKVVIIAFLNSKFTSPSQLSTFSSTIIPYVNSKYLKAKFHSKVIFRIFQSASLCPFYTKSVYYLESSETFPNTRCNRSIRNSNLTVYL